MSPGLLKSVYLEIGTSMEIDSVAKIVSVCPYMSIAQEEELVVVQSDSR